MRNLPYRDGLTKIKGLFFLIVLFYGCASVQQPQGGPRDTTPPKVLKMLPANQSTNFKADKISIEFDEYFNLQNEFKEVTISPEMEKPPILKKKQKKLEVQFQEPLAANTTYTINFGNAIADANESNVLKNFTYVFSTGPVLDSLTIGGKVINAYTKLPELDILVFLLPVSQDTTFGKKKPAIYTRTDTAGNFNLKNLRNDTYRIYALKDANGDKLYQQGADHIGFLKDSIKLTQPVDTLTLQFFKETPSQFRVLERKIAADGTLLLSFNRSLKAPKVTITDPPGLDDNKLYTFNKSTDSVRIWLSNMDFDSVKVAVNENENLLQTVNISRNKKDTYTRLLTPADNLEGGMLNPANRFKLTFPIPVTDVDISKITLLEDSVARTNFKAVKDSSGVLSYFIDYAWKPKTKYELRFAEGAFTGIFNAKSKYFSKKLEASPATNYGAMELKVTLERPNTAIILELINEGKALVSRHFFKADTVIKYNNLRVGKYFVRVIYDQNNNGIWDTGILETKTQPEPIWYDPRAFPIRANWLPKSVIEIPKL